MTTRAAERTEGRGRVSARQRAENHKGFEKTSFKVPDGMQLFTVESDDVVKLNILAAPVGAHNPYADKGSLHYELTYFAHRGIGANEETYVCPKRTRNERCPICEARSRMSKEAEADEELIKSLAAKERQLFYVEDTESDKGIQLWDISYHLFGKLLDKRIKDSDPEDEWEFFSDPKAGSTLKIGFEEKSFNRTDFYDAKTIDFKPREKNYSKEVTMGLTPLDDLLVVLPYDQLYSIFMQLDDAGNPPATDGAEAPPKADRKAAGKGKGKDKPAAEEPAAKAPAPKDDDDWDDDPTPPAKQPAKAAEAPKKDPAPADDDNWDDAPAPTATPAAKPKPAAAADDDDDWDEAPAAPKEAPKPHKFAVGEKCNHEEHGKCEVVRVKETDAGQVLMILTKSDEQKRVPASECKPVK